MLQRSNEAVKDACDNNEGWVKDGNNNEVFVFVKNGHGKAASIHHGRKVAAGGRGRSEQVEPEYD